MTNDSGIVYLVGAGPGDPGLITVRGSELLKQANVVIHDRLLEPQILSGVRSDAEIIHVGKAPGCHTVAQDQINDLLIDRARRGLCVVRLKGGDPFVFGRGFEELTACREAGIDCVVVPGVTSAVSGPAAAGIPITERLLVRSFAVISARPAHDSRARPLNYKALAGMDTLIVLMGRTKLREIAEALIEAGRDPNVPAACVEWATTHRQRVTVATLATIAQQADEDQLCAPVVTVIGEVAAHASNGSMMEMLPGAMRHNEREPRTDGPKKQK